MSEYVKERFQTALFFSALLAILIFFGIDNPVGIFTGLLIVPLWLYNTVTYIYRARKIIMYRNSIRGWIDSFENKTCSIELNEESITLKMDEEVIVITWPAVRYSLINEKRISIQSDIQIFLPASAMTSEEYAYLRSMVIKKVQRKYGDDEEEDQLLMETPES